MFTHRIFHDNISFCIGLRLPGSAMLLNVLHLQRSSSNELTLKMFPERHLPHFPVPCCNESMPAAILYLHVFLLLFQPRSYSKSSPHLFLSPTVYHFSVTPVFIMINSVSNNPVDASSFPFYKELLFLCLNVTFYFSFFYFF